MTTPAKILWTLSGEPQPSKAVESCETACAVCGVWTYVGARYRRVFGASFTDHDLLPCPTSSHVCPACTWSIEGKPPNTLRLWSFVYPCAAPPNPKASTAKDGSPLKLAPALSSGRLWAGSKDQAEVIVDMLLQPPSEPWWVSVTTSGQIHTVPFARTNHGDMWTVRYERSDVAATSTQFAEALHHAATLYAAGFVREDIATLQPAPSKLVKYGIGLWRRHATPLQRWHGSDLLDLVVWLLRKETADDYAHRSRPDGPGRRVFAGHDVLGLDRRNPSAGLVGEGEGRARNERSGGRELATDGRQIRPEDPGDGDARQDVQSSLLDWAAAR